MTWWGKIAGAILGWFLFSGVRLGPLGFIIGLAVGHQFDRGFAKARGAIPRYGVRELQAIFFASAFSVMGHMAKADGRVSEDEIRMARAIMQQLRLAPDQVKEAIRLFTDGKRSDFPLRDTIEKFRLASRGRHDLNRAFMAFDDTTGERLWKTELDDIPSSNIVSYSVDGKQYVAVVVGMTNYNVRDLGHLYHRFAPELDMPVNDSPKGGAAVWVFALGS